MRCERGDGTRTVPIEVRLFRPQATLSELPKRCGGGSDRPARGTGLSVSAIVETGIQTGTQMSLHRKSTFVNNRRAVPMGVTQKP